MARWPVVSVVLVLGSFGLYPDCVLAHDWHCIWLAPACWGFCPAGG
jgi:hypothetical protein